MRLIPFRHEAAGFTLPLPEDWERVLDAPSIALVAVEPERDGWFRSNIVVTIERFPAVTSPTEWTAAADEMLGKALHRYVRIDSETLQIDGRDVRRTLAHHTTEGNHAVTVEQWALTANGHGYTLTGSAGTLDYHQVADVFAAVAEGFRPDPEFVS
jgi:hypothetical protein